MTYDMLIHNQAFGRGRIAGWRQFALLGDDEAKDVIRRAEGRVVAVRMPTQPGTKPEVVWATHPDLDGGTRP